MIRLKSFLNTRKADKVLDIGSGNGAFITQLMNLYDGTGEIIGIDELEIAVSTANKNFVKEPRVSFIQMDANNMDFPDNEFGIVTLSNSLHHLETPEKTFAEMERVLEKYGLIIVNEMIRDGLTKKQKSHRMIHHFAAEIDREMGSFHNETYKGVDIVTMLKGISSLKIKSVFEVNTVSSKENTQEEIDWLLSTLDRVMKNVKDTKRLAYYKKKSEKIKKHVRKYGFARATQLVVVLG